MFSKGKKVKKGTYRLNFPLGTIVQAMIWNDLLVLVHATGSKYTIYFVNRKFELLPIKWGPIDSTCTKNTIKWPDGRLGVLLQAETERVLLIDLVVKKGLGDTNTSD